MMFTKIVRVKNMIIMKTIVVVMMIRKKKKLYLMRAETLSPVVKIGQFSYWPSTQCSLVLLLVMQANSYLW